MPQDALSPARERLAIAALFFANGFAFANWATRIPQMQASISLGDAALGTALLALAVGALLAMPPAGGVIARIGPARVTRISSIAMCAMLGLSAWAGTFVTLMALLAALGACIGCMDVAMNAQGAANEGRMGRPVMASFHGSYSLGGLAGAGTGGVFAGAAIEPVVHLGVVAAALLVLVAWLCARLPPGAMERPRGATFAWPGRELLIPATVAFCVLLSEGAMADWSTLYLLRETGARAGEAAAGFAAFSAAMAFGRFVGDRLIQRFGAEAVMRWGGVIAVAGIGLALASSRVIWATTGFALIGVGLSCVFPCLVSAAARSRTMGPGPAIASVATLGYTGFLLGPPLIGYVAEIASLRSALGIVALSCVMVVLLAGRVRT